MQFHYAEIDDSILLKAVEGVRTAMAGKALGPLSQAVEALEARMIEGALTAPDDNEPRAAAPLEISERQLGYKLKWRSAP